MVTDAQARATAKWRKSSLKQYSFSAHREHDADVIEKLDSMPNKADYLKSLIRKDAEQ